MLSEKSWILILLGEKASKLDHESGTEMEEELEEALLSPLLLISRSKEPISS